jgi:hypothetical protein
MQALCAAKDGAFMHGAVFHPGALCTGPGSTPGLYARGPGPPRGFMHGACFHLGALCSGGPCSTPGFYARGPVPPQGFMHGTCFHLGAYARVLFHPGALCIMHGARRWVGSFTSLGMSRGPQGLTQISQGSLGVVWGPQRPDSK